MTISIRPWKGSFVGEVPRIDTTRHISGEEVAAIEASMGRHAGLVFRDQALTDEPHAWKVHDRVMGGQPLHDGPRVPLRPSGGP